MQATIVLVRHALPVIPAPGGPDEFTRPLTPQGLAQAAALVPELAALAPAAVWSSPYLRAIQTVAPTAEALGLPIQTRHDLREWEHQAGPQPDFRAFVIRCWADPSFAPPGGECLNELTVRATAAVRSLAAASRGQTVLVGSHGTFVSMALRGLGLTFTEESFAAMPMPAIYTLRFPSATTVPKATGPGLICPERDH